MPQGRGQKQTPRAFKDRGKPASIRYSNITAAKAVADAIRTSLGPRGMDKMIRAPGGDITITNDGATILKEMQVVHPTAKMLVELAKAQDIEAGDGTTTVVVLAGSLLSAAQRLLDKGIHPTTISESFESAAAKAIEILQKMAVPVSLENREALIRIATTSLNSKVVSQYSSLLAPMCVEAVLKVASGNNADLNDVRVIKKLGGTVEDTELVEGLVFTKKLATPTISRAEKAKIGLIQFWLSPPKTDMENQVIISDYSQMDRVMREEKQYILDICKAIKRAGCTVLLVQKSILRDALNDLAIHFLTKLKIMTIKDVERDDVEFICKTIGCKPVASVDHFKPEMLGYADLVEEVSTGDSKMVRITGLASPSKTVTLLVRGSNKLVLEEAERSIHDALCVVRCLVKKGFLVAGGGAPEIEVSQKLMEIAHSLTGMEDYCFRAFAEALEVIPCTLAENVGLSPIATVTDLRNRHAKGETSAGINVRKGIVANIMEEHVVQPLLVSTSAFQLAAETVRSILKIDDIVHAQRT
ncbi:T-complex protein 1 subunit delta-like [Oscarella lobularis]|uniref:T-complex protein 1 subunit delta-like n=1 Tax=Oscarella lobularis TaxID=121494 RepID=UPI0033131FAC